jgi:hypothetical protein
VRVFKGGDGGKRRDHPSPVPFPGHEPGNTFLPDHPDILFVSISMDRCEEFLPLTHLCIAAFPAPGDLFFLAARPDLAERRTATVMAPLPAPELHHSPEELVPLLIMPKGFPERRSRNGRGELVKLYMPQFFLEVAGKIGYLPGIPVAVKAAEPALHNPPRFSSIIKGVSGFGGLYFLLGE